MEQFSLSPKEVDRLYDGDPVLSFVRRVNIRAVAKPIWNTDFRRALYEAFEEESQARLIAIVKHEGQR